MTSTRLLALLLVASSAALTACTGPLPGPTTGTITLDLVGTAPSGRSYRLRDATITVQGPGAVKVWNTEDAPDQTSLSADVAVGDYTALLADGWRLERIDGASATPVAAVLVSANPAQFAVAAHQRTAVPLRFRVDGDEVDMTQGYDITIVVDEPSPPVMAVLNGGDPGSVPPRQPSITVYPADGDGDRSPLRTIAGPNTTLQLASDLVVAGDRIIVCQRDAIVMFPITASGDVAPVARIAGPATGLTSARAIAVSNGEIYVFQGGQVVAVFPLTGNGNIPVTRRFIITGLLNPFHMLVDHGELYVVDTIGNQTFVKVYPASAAGNVEPTRTLRWAPATDALALGLAIRGAELFVATEFTIDVLPAGADGPVTPVRSLSPTLGVFQIMEFHDEIYAANPFLGSVQVFSADASGTVAPTRTISGPSTQLDGPLAVVAN
jgi:hypothetical protein